MRSKKPLAKLNKPTDVRSAMLKNMSVSLIQYESITTITSRAKSLASYMDRLINRAKKNDINAKRYIKSLLPDEKAYNKVFEVLIERYKDVTGGYTTRVFEVNRTGDNSRMSKISFVKLEKEKKVEEVKSKVKSKREDNKGKEDVKEEKSEIKPKKVRKTTKVSSKKKENEA